ncbi:putative LRR receptor-like serine/threonine-protein kinase [Arachis hypogaea]|nr:putative LRR receptor-like serine/threonine-protein kinase [Arachis hypogaea]
MTFFWRLTLDSSMNLAFNAKLRRQSSNKAWTIIYFWKALDVYFPTPLRARQLEFCSSRKSISSAGRSDSNSISSPFVSLLQSFAQEKARYSVPSSTISNLTNLRALYLDDIITFTNGTESTWLAPFFSLQYLGLTQMDLSMDLYKNTTSIKVLDISVLDPLRNLTSIKDLRLSSNQNLIWPPQWFAHFEHLQVIILRDCGFVSDLPSILQNITSIRSHDFSENSLTSIVPLRKFENLVELNL